MITHNSTEIQQEYVQSKH